MQRVEERLRGKNGALLEHAGNLRFVVVNRPDKIEAVGIPLCQIPHPSFENPKPPNVQFAELGHKVDIHPATDGMSYKMPAMECRVGRVWMPCHPSRIPFA